MNSYILKPKSVRKSEIENKEYSLSGFSFRKINHKNSNIFLLKDENILSKNIKGFESGSAEYINFSDNYFVRISEMKDLDFTFDISKDTKKIRPVKNSNKTKLIKKGDICYQTASNVGNICIYDNLAPAYYNSHIRKLEFKKDKYYIFAILKSSFGREQADVAGSIKGVDNFREEYLLNTKIPFPTKNNHEEPQKIESLVSLITQNIINKEEQIKAKNQKIDELIEKELKENQKPQNSFKYSYPKISEIKQETRLDTGIYEREFKEIDFLIRNYGGGFFQIPFKNIKTGQTPKDYYYPKEKKNNDVSLWITPKNLNHNVLSQKLWIHTNNDSTLKDGDIIFGSRGTVGDLLFYDKQELGKSYINQSTSSIKIEGEKHKKIYTLSYFSSSIFKIIVSKYIYKGTVPAITPDILTKFLIPNFPNQKQQEIAKEYYNKIDKNQNLTLENYLQKETTRNHQIGIFQLNMEIFILREKLEEIIDKIINDLPIEINLNY